LQGSGRLTGSKHQGLLVPGSLVKQVNGLFGENKDAFLALLFIPIILNKLKQENE
jgi:hypothetical protein